MVKSNDELYGQAKELSTNVDDNFLELGKALRQLQDRDPEMFRQLYESNSDLGRRKAYYLVAVSRTFDPLPISRLRLKKIGWTKLEILSHHITKDNAQELLQLAEESTAKQLGTLMKGEKPINNARCVLMYFTPKEYKVLEEALVNNGGQRSGRGFLNKEKALIAALKKLKKLDVHTANPEMEAEAEAEEPVAEVEGI